MIIKKLYTITDLQSEEKMEPKDAQEILDFAEDIFWDEPDVVFTDIKKAIKAIETSDYEVTELPIKNKVLELEI